jgi:hypothetical protein
MRSSLKNIPISISILHDTEHRNIMKHILGKRRAYSDCNLLNRTRCDSNLITGSTDRKVANTQMSHSVTVA